MSAIFIFAHPKVRAKAYNFFWKVHQLYVLLYFLCIIHGKFGLRDQNTGLYFNYLPITGLQRITAAPFFWVYFIFPALIYTFDKIVTFRTSYMELDILETELLPSDVLRIRFYRPPNMKVLSGQWIRFTCTSLAPEVK